MHRPKIGRMVLLDATIRVCDTISIRGKRSPSQWQTGAQTKKEACSHVFVASYGKFREIAFYVSTLVVRIELVSPCKHQNIGSNKGAKTTRGILSWPSMSRLRH